MSPSIKTIKRLFSLSRNRCAFDSCTDSLVDKDTGTILGEVCHICAESVGGPRFLASQTESQRHGFDNLILMCPKHHKVIDEHPDRHTVQTLQALKARAEEGSQIDWDQKLIQKLAIEWAKRTSQSVAMTASRGSANIVANSGSTAITTIHSGITYSEARQICQDVFELNSVKMTEVAGRVAERRVADFRDQFMEELRNRAPESVVAFAEPDMQAAVFEAQKTVARSTRSEIAAVLVDVLVARAAAKDDFMKIVLNESIAATSKLTLDQMDALSIMFVARYTRDFGVRSEQQFTSKMEQIVGPLLGSACRSLAKFQHLQYVGCGSIEIAALNFESIVARNYPHVLVTTLPMAEVHSLPKETVEHLKRINAIQSVSTDTYAVVPAFDVDFQRLAKDGGIPATLGEEWLRFLVSKAEPLSTLTRLERMSDTVGRLCSYWSTTSAHKFTLTSVGIAIGHANLARHGVTGFDLSVWIN